MAELSRKEAKLQKKLQKKREKAQAKRKKKIQNELDWCLVIVYLLVFLAAAAVEMLRDGSLRKKINAERKK